MPTSSDHSWHLAPVSGARCYVRNRGLSGSAARQVHTARQAGQHSTHLSRFYPEHRPSGARDALPPSPVVSLREAGRNRWASVGLCQYHTGIRLSAMNDAMVPGRSGCIEHDTKNKRGGEQDFYHVRHCAILSRWLRRAVNYTPSAPRLSDQDHCAVALRFDL